MPDLNARENPGAAAGAPQGWNEAFAGLEMETPPGDGWARVARKLDALSYPHHRARRERRTTWLIGMASAAVLALAAWSPLSRWLQSEGSETQLPVAVAATHGLRGPAAPVSAESGAAQPALQRVETDPEPESLAVRSTAASAHPKSARSVRNGPKKTHAAAETPAVVLASQAQPEPAAGGGVAADADALQKLQSQSAQLEALVALARDDRVGNAGSELLSGELDAGIAAIDASLSQQDLTETRKQDLWQQRVSLLQQLAGVEATSRWLAAQGMSNETALVSVD